MSALPDIPVPLSDARPSTPLSRADAKRTRSGTDAGRVDPDMRGRPGRLSVAETATITRRITLVTLLTAVVLALGKAVVWLDSGSVGVLASLVHSLLDLSGAVGSFVAVRFAARAPGGGYSYGRGKAEGVAAVFQMCLVALAALHLLEAAVDDFGLFAGVAGEGGAHADHAHGPDFRASAGGGHAHAPNVSGPAILILLGVSALTLWLVTAQSWAVRATGSLAVRGDRAHFTADLVSGLVVLVGLLLSGVAGFAWVDAAVGAVFALWLLWTAARLGRSAWVQLMDRELPEDERLFIRNIALQDARVQAVRHLRSRAAGPHIHIQMEVDLDDRLSLGEAHGTCVAAERRIRGVYRAADVRVSPHPVACGVETHARG